MTVRRTDISVVTSCSLQGWEQYGKKCLPTLLKYWPENVTVYLVSEDVLPLGDIPLLAKDKLITLPLSTSAHAKKFYEKYKYDHKARGRLRATSYNYTYDAWKFSKKVFAIELVTTLIPAGRLFWLDADVRTFKVIPASFLDKMCPEDCNLSFLARKKIHTECGFVGYNLNNPPTREFIHAFANTYSEGHVFRLKEWHDSWVFDWLRTRYPNLVEFKIPHISEFHPFNYSALGKYMDHWKGNRKISEGSTDHPNFKKHAVRFRKIR